MNSTKAISSTFEMSLRILLLLSEVKEHTLSIMQMCEIDFIAVYAADFGLLDENLHGYGEYRYSEFLTRKPIVSNAVKRLVIRKCINFKLTKNGYHFQINNEGLTLANKLSTPYAEEYKLAIKAVTKAYKLSESLMLVKINQHTLRSLQEESHE